MHVVHLTLQLNTLPRSKGPHEETLRAQNKPIMSEILGISGRWPCLWSKGLAAYISFHPQAAEGSRNMPVKM